MKKIIWIVDEIYDRIHKGAHIDKPLTSNAAGALGYSKLEDR